MLWNKFWTLYDMNLVIFENSRSCTYIFDNVYSLKILEVLTTGDVRYETSGLIG